MKNIELRKQPVIMLVDDSPEHIEMVVAVLRQHHYDIRIATKGSTALNLLRQHQPDLILLDVYMPEMDGFEVCKMIKADEKLCSIPIIFFTASNDEESIKKGFELGAQDYVLKPFHTSELLARINTHIKLKQQAHSLQEAYNELDSFCYSVSHDLKAPLHSINKLTKYLVEDCLHKLDADDQELIAHIQEKSSEVITMINRLLEFSRMCKQDLMYESIELDKVFLDSYHELLSLEPHRKVNVQLDTLPVIQGDPIMIRLLVSNILSNALKFTRNREIATINITSSETESDYIISVQDNGVGFDMTYLSKLFGVFQRLHSQNDFEGSGVGLAIIQRILMRHHGEAWITGEIDKGATLSFRIPK